MIGFKQQFSQDLSILQGYGIPIVYLQLCFHCVAFQPKILVKKMPITCMGT
jgi:hypothetical protein